MQILTITDYVITSLFFLELLIKVISKGLVFNNIQNIQPYLSSYWNIIDAVVVMGSLINIGFMLAGVNMTSLQALKALRALRGLRPLRVISRNDGLRLVVNALIASLPSMANVLLVCTLFILVFSIIGGMLFGDKFNYCKTALNGVEINLDLIDTKLDCID